MCVGKKKETLTLDTKIHQQVSPSLWKLDKSCSDRSSLHGADQITPKTFFSGTSFCTQNVSSVNKTLKKQGTPSSLLTKKKRKGKQNNEEERLTLFTQVKQRYHLITSWIHVERLLVYLVNSSW